MPCTTIVIAPDGTLTAEGDPLPDLARHFAAPPTPVNCARPPSGAIVPLPPATRAGTSSIRVARIYHGSVIDGPGRRSVLAFQGCPLRCPGCYVPETHDPEAGTPLTIPDAVRLLLDPAGAPRDGVTLLGGEPTAQPDALLAAAEAIAAAGVPLLLYTGYTLAELLTRRDPRILRTLALLHHLLDGPFDRRQTARSGSWRGSRNQHLIDRQALAAALRPIHP